MRGPGTRGQDGIQIFPDLKAPDARPGQSPRDPVGPEQRRSSPKKAEPKEAKPVPNALRRPGASSVPEAASQRAQLLEELYANLATATDEQVAVRVAAAIEHVWLTSASDTVNVLIERSVRAGKEKSPATAIKLLDQAAGLAPDYPEVFARRAMAHYEQGQIQQALGDLRRVLALDPSHFKALDGLGQILKEIGQKKAALAVYRRLYEVHPFWSGAKAALDEIEREVEGQRS